ncbi:MAG: UDP-N-acetylglucosamine--N-acetylmuramyl-(pentapeptide) pyrophosphoryl-undecaprenol N-acetylglucosamine transferase [Chloroflexi bacterium]|nr:UDP-N-acetylglucosamine--N-acetylmuramyl-(pentapeptide) pyrophosphoryl-undecaprenol N-acetylglucosamine transferase [Chloroflexota bacterium]
MTRILISAGGTGGGVYPALAVAEVLRQQPDVVLHFVSSATGLENDLLTKAGIRLDEWDKVQAGPLHRVNPIKLIRSIFRLFIGIGQSLALLRRKKPAVVFLTGGWVGIPVAIAAWLYRIPMVIFVPDIEPGRTLKLLGRFAKVITATSRDTARYYGKNKQVVETGYPLRSSLLTVTREQSIQALGLDSTKKTLLVFGGSQGSRAINRAVMSGLPELLKNTELQIFHVSGKLDAAAVQSAHDELPDELQSRYHVRDYVHEFGYALAAADLAISRAGASTLGEDTFFGLPAILVPLANTWRYQKVNADWLAERGAAIHLEEERMAEELVPLVNALFNDPARLNLMKEAARKLAYTDGAANIAKEILNLAAF